MQIMDALKRFGIKENSRNLICVKILESDEQFNHGDMIDVIKGDEIDFNDNNLSGLYDKEVIKKVCVYPLKKCFSILYILFVFTRFVFFSFQKKSILLTRTMQNYKLGNFKPESDEDLTRAVVNAIQLRGL